MEPTTGQRRKHSSAAAPSASAERSYSSYSSSRGTARGLTCWRRPVGERGRGSRGTSSEQPVQCSARTGRTNAHTQSTCTHPRARGARARTHAPRTHARRRTPHWVCAESQEQAGASKTLKAEHNFLPVGCSCGRRFHPAGATQTAAAAPAEPSSTDCAPGLVCPGGCACRHNGGSVVMQLGLLGPAAVAPPCARPMRCRLLFEYDGGRLRRVPCGVIPTE